MEIPILRLEYSEEEMASIKEGIEAVMKSGYLTMGERVAQFEARLSAVEARIGGLAQELQACVTGSGLGAAPVLISNHQAHFA